MAGTEKQDMLDLAFPAAFPFQQGRALLFMSAQGEEEAPAEEEAEVVDTMVGEEGPKRAEAQVVAVAVVEEAL